MDTNTLDWSNVHDQLWTSFKRSQDIHSAQKKVGDGVPDNVVLKDSLCGSCTTPISEIASLVLGEVMISKDPSEPVFTKELEGQIDALIEERGTNSAIRDLLITVKHLKNRTEKMGGENAYLHESIRGMSEEVMHHLNGSEADSVDEAIGERNGAIMQAENRLCRILIECEKSKALIRKFSECVFGFTHAGSSSMREMLETLCASSETLSSVHRNGARGSDVEVMGDTETLQQVMDIIGMPTGADSSDAPDCALHLIKNLEMLRRENHAQAALLLQYEKTVLGVFSSCGVVSPPTVEQVRELLRTSADTEGGGRGDKEPNACSVRGDHAIARGTAFSPDNPWITLHLQELITAMIDISESSFLGPVPQGVLGGPTSASAEDVLKYMQGSISAARELLLKLARNEMETRISLEKVHSRISSWNTDLYRNNSLNDNEGRITFTRQRPLPDIARELEKIAQLPQEQQLPRQDEQSSLQNGKHQYEGGTSNNLLSNTSPVETSELRGRLADGLLRVFRLFPKDYVADFSPPEGLVREEAMCQCIEKAVRQLTDSRSVLISRIASLLENLQQEVSSLAEPPSGSAAHARIFDSLAAGWQCLSEFRADTLHTNASGCIADDEVMRTALHELAQLLPTGTPASDATESVSILPPVNNLLEMVRLVRHRQEQWLQAQKRQRVSGAQGRLDRARLEETVQNRGQRLARLAEEILHPGLSSSESETLNTVDEANTELGDHAKKSKSTMELFDDLEERMRHVKSRYHKLMQSHAADRVRLENLTQFSSAHIRRWSRISGAVAAVCRLVGMESTAERIESLERSSKVETVDPQATPQVSQGATGFRPDQHKSTVSPPVGDTDILDALRVVEERLRQNDALRSRAVAKSNEVQLEDIKRSWREETATFRQAIEMIVERLAEAGQRVKRVLFMLGTDESPKDEVLEGILSEHSRRAEEAREKQQAVAEMENDRDRENARQIQRERNEEGNHDASGSDVDEEQQKTNTEMRRRQEADEEALATLLQKFSRWATRLHETTEDHLYTQQKISKYLATVHRFFSHVPAGSPRETSESDENIIDIDATLMRFTDDILPALDRAVIAAQSIQENSEKSTNINNDSEGSCDSNGKCIQAQMMALAMLLQGAPRDRVLMTDHRLLRLYEALARLRTMVSGLLSVQYLAIPSAVRPRRSNGDDELVFEDGWGESEYVELDLMKLTHSDGGGSGNPSSNDDVLLRALETNLASIYQALGKFSTNYKLAVILVQKDTEVMQQFLADMLEPYVELDVEQAFGQNATALGEIFALLRNRAKRQRGCYFFNRIAGEGPCVWAVALEQLSVGFSGILVKLRRRTRIAAEMREMLDDVIDLCAIYANWVELSGAATIHPLPGALLESCVREGQDARPRNEAGENNESKVEAKETDKKCLGSGLRSERKEVKEAAAPKSAPPKPPLPPHALPKISHFTSDAVVLKVMAHMLQLAQMAVVARDDRQQQQQMEEQLQVARETTAVAAQRVSRAEAERDSAQSEAAVCRAELRRWKRLHGIVDEESPPATTAAPSHALANKASSHEQGVAHTENKNNKSSGEAEGLLLEVARSVRELTAELRSSASQRTIACPSPVLPTAPLPPPPPPDTTVTTSSVPESINKTPNNNSKPTAHSKSKSSSSFLQGSNAKANVDARGNSDKVLAQTPGLVVSPNESLRARSFSPPSSVSSLPASNVMPAALTTGGTTPYKMIAPASVTYADIAQGRYRPSDHRGGFFEICEVCTRRHHGSTCLRDQRTRSQQRKESLMKRRTVSPLSWASQSSKVQRPQSQMRNSSPSLTAKRRAASLSSESVRKDAFLHHQLYLERQKSGQKKWPQDSHHRHDNHTRSNQNNGSREVEKKSDPLLSLSTAEALSPTEHNEENDGGKDAPIYLHTNHSQRHPVHISNRSPQVRTRHTGRTSRSDAGEKDTFGTPLRVLKQYVVKSSADGYHSERNHRYTSGSETPARDRESRQNVNMQSGALKKLEDIVAKTKLTGREDL